MKCSRAMTILAVVMGVCLSASLAKANLIGHWTLDETGSPYANSVSGGDALTLDAGTTPANSGSGVFGNGVELTYNAVPGVATRLNTGSDQQAGNTFGFSFFMNPGYIANGNILLAGEADNGTVTGRAFDYWNWAVRATPSGTGLGLEFIVRGQGGSGTGEGYASLSSSEFLIDGGGQSGHWYHIAGGYDAADGSMNLFVRDMTDDLSSTMFSGGGDAGLTTQGAGLTLGTVEYGGSYVAFAAGSYMDDVKLFDSMLTAGDVAALQSIPEPTTLGFLLFGAIAAGVTRRMRG